MCELAHVPKPLPEKEKLPPAINKRVSSMLAHSLSCMCMCPLAHVRRACPEDKRLSSSIDTRVTSMHSLTRLCMRTFPLTHVHRPRPKEKGLCPSSHVCARTRAFACACALSHMSYGRDLSDGTCFYRLKGASKVCTQTHLLYMCMDRFVK